MAGRAELSSSFKIENTLLADEDSPSGRDRKKWWPFPARTRRPPPGTVATRPDLQTAGPGSHPQGTPTLPGRALFRVLMGAPGFPGPGATREEFVVKRPLQLQGTGGSLQYRRQVSFGHRAPPLISSAARHSTR
ncbi:hypothetical protein H1C71_041656 [Ictidomys tridecemlineatus]|nr:hypothetical protein H1C71_041656 [Ictidomys tridecemlineatus]